MRYPSQNLANIAIAIGHYFLKKNNEDYEKTAKELQTLHIVDIREDDDTIFITTARPGLLIGRRGCNIDALIEVLKKKLHIIEHFSWADVMTPIDYNAEMEAYDEHKHYLPRFLDIITAKEIDKS